MKKQSIIIIIIIIVIIIIIIIIGEFLHLITPWDQVFGHTKHNFCIVGKKTTTFSDIFLFRRKQR